MNISIINVGNELIEGDTLNSNAHFISKEIYDIGGNIKFHSVCRDIKKDLLDLLEFNSKRSNVVILTGGLGPTKDDMTKEILADFLNLELKLDKSLALDIKEKFEKYNRVMVESNIKQAYMIEGSKTLYNDNGTAPGLLIEKNNVIYILLPGPPRELIPMFKNYVLEFLNKRFDNKYISKIIKLSGIGESAAETEIRDLIDLENVYIGTYAQIGEVKIKISSYNKVLLEKVFNEVKSRFLDNIISLEMEDTSIAVCEYLIKEKISISTAESCTGGMIASKIVENSGISDIYPGSLITYSNELKQKYLNVSIESLNKYGAVSSEVVNEMVIGLYEKFNTDISIAISGIAGPNGGTKEKPVGLVYIGIKIYDDIYIYEEIFRGNRTDIRERTTKKVFNEIYRKILLTK